MTVKTTRKTWDPSMILKGRDLIKLLARSLPVLQALKILEDGMYTDIIKIKNMVRNKERYVKRRQRLIGPNGCTLKAIELVTGCYTLVQGNTVSAMGSIHGLKAVRKIVMECMKNIHPIYNIKILMIKKELAADPALKEENWERFLPQFKKKNVARRRAPAAADLAAAAAAFTPFPPAQLPRKIDAQLESGEYFLSEEEKRNKAKAEKKALAEVKADAKKSKRDSLFQAPDETPAADTAAAAESESEVKSEKKKSKKSSSKDAEASEEADAASEKKKSSKKIKRESADAMDTSTDAAAASSSSAAAASSSSATAVAAPAVSSAAAAAAFAAGKSRFGKPAKKRKLGESQATVPESERREASKAATSAPDTIDVQALKAKFQKHTVRQATHAHSSPARAVLRCELFLVCSRFP